MVETVEYDADCDVCPMSIAGAAIIYPMILTIDPQADKQLTSLLLSRVKFGEKTQDRAIPSSSSPVGGAPTF